MAGSSIVVDRREKLGWAASLYLPSLLRSLRVSVRHFAGSLRRMGKGRGRSAIEARELVWDLLEMLSGGRVSSGTLGLLHPVGGECAR